MPHLRLVQADRLHAASGAAAPVIMRLGLRDGFVFDEYDGFGLTVVGRTLAQARLEPGLTRVARDKHHLDVLLDCDTWWNELEPDERPANFRASLLDFNMRFDPRLHSLTDQQENDYVRHVFQEAERASATIWTAPYHTGGDPDCPARKLDLRIAELAAQTFRGANLDQGGARRIFCVIAISPRVLHDPLARATLVLLYAGTSVDGFVVKPIGFSEASSSVDVDAVTLFIADLRRRAARPVVAAGAKNLSLPLIAADLASAVMIGIGEGETFQIAGSGGGGSRPVWHSGALRSVSPKSKSPLAVRRAWELFKRYPCDCDHHPADRPPLTEDERKLHTFTRRIRDFYELSSSDGEALFRQRFANAQAIAAALGYPPLPPSYLRVLEIAARIRRRDARELGDA